MENNESPLNRLNQIKESPEELRDPDCINEYLKEEEYITVIEVNGKQKKYKITDSGRNILEKVN